MNIYINMFFNKRFRRKALLFKDSHFTKGEIAGVVLQFEHVGVCVPAGWSTKKIPSLCSFTGFLIQGTSMVQNWSKQKSLNPFSGQNKTITVD